MKTAGPFWLKKGALSGVILWSRIIIVRNMVSAFVIYTGICIHRSVLQNQVRYLTSLCTYPYKGTDKQVVVFRLQPVHFLSTSL